MTKEPPCNTQTRQKWEPKGARRGRPFSPRKEGLDVSQSTVEENKRQRNQDSFSGKKAPRRRKGEEEELGVVNLQEEGVGYDG